MMRKETALPSHFGRRDDRNEVQISDVKAFCGATTARAREKRMEEFSNLFGSTNASPQDFEAVADALRLVMRLEQIFDRAVVTADDLREAGVGTRPAWDDEVEVFVPVALFNLERAPWNYLELFAFGIHDEAPVVFEGRDLPGHYDPIGRTFGGLGTGTRTVDGFYIHANDDQVVEGLYLSPLEAFDLADPIGPRHALGTLINALMNAHLHNVHLRFECLADDQRDRLRLWTRNGLEGLWWCLADGIRRGVEFSSCEWCGAPFPGRGLQRAQAGRFCCDAHRQTAGEHPGHTLTTWNEEKATRKAARKGEETQG